MTSMDTLLGRALFDPDGLGLDGVLLGAVIRCVLSNHKVSVYNFMLYMVLASCNQRGQCFESYFRKQTGICVKEAGVWGGADWVELDVLVCTSIFWLLSFVVVQNHRRACDLTMYLVSLLSTRPSHIASNIIRHSFGTSHFLHNPVGRGAQLDDGRGVRGLRSTASEEERRTW